MPDVVKKYAVVGTYAIEILLPFLFYSPFRMHRIVAALGNMLLMVVIMATGNYNFFNVLTMAL